MEPITTAIVAVAAGEIVKDEVKTTIVDFFKEKAIGRWSEHRAKKFFDAFVDEVRKERDVLTTSADLNDMLKSLARSDEQTSALFDAYRRVALSASKDMGPMIIGLLTARLVLEDRDASEIEEMVFEGAEVLKDKDFSDLQNWMHYAHQDQNYSLALAGQAGLGVERISIAMMAKGEVTPVYLTRPETSRAVASSYGQHLLQTDKDESPLNIFRDVGPFALKLRNAGLLEEEARPRGQPRNPSGTNYFVLVSPACEELNALSLRAAEAVEKS
ncbi:hypothetical protein [Paraburkholderia sp. BL10I2N1]|uniref:hypothetical protein n=1 Tax=Paraburkholderia sp. BL10I2N1 TaxID=1938796 RepID=UPI00105FD433|nr:hypothetical protein [Paraburkholderia sp. BL10I2N1]TDN61435.1 hypothetical protein B0G77_4896 [Paraburkholderia sp. BL10I2N1]